jgi:UDP-galactopyranose mutase
VVDDAGFTWDRGGHVVFSHYGEFDRLLADVMGEDVTHHERSSYVLVGETWVPYPFQSNLHRLPPALAEETLLGLIEAQSVPAAPVADDFESWMTATFGTGIVRHFMRPYNEKVWAHPASSMSAAWMAERVATVDWRQALRSVVHRADDLAWGPNNLFLFPTRGGTGEIYRRAAATLGSRISYGSVVRGVEVGERAVTLGDGRRLGYDHLVWTGPLDRLVAVADDAPAEVRAAAGALVHNSVTVVGMGYEAPVADDRSWLYFPDPDVPFYRATNFAKYAAANVPGGRTDRYCSWMTEVASSPWRPLEQEGLVDRVDGALRRVGLVPPDAPIATAHVEHLEYGYPVPTRDRDAALGVIQPWLMAHGVLSRGRFGAWRYELGNMDHAVKMGVDAAHRIIDGTPEEAWRL